MGQSAKKWMSLSRWPSQSSPPPTPTTVTSHPHLPPRPRRPVTLTSHPDHGDQSPVSTKSIWCCVTPVSVDYHWLLTCTLLLQSFRAAIQSEGVFLKQQWQVGDDKLTCRQSVVPLTTRIFFFFFSGFHVDLICMHIIMVTVGCIRVYRL